MAPGLLERVHFSAFSRALGERQDTRALFNHDANLPLGRTTSGALKLSTDPKGLKYRIELPNSPTGQNVAVSVARGDVRQSSFLFAVRQETYHREGNWDIRTLMDVDLYDVSPVTFPAYESSTVAPAS